MLQIQFRTLIIFLVLLFFVPPAFATQVIANVSPSHERVSSEDAAASIAVLAGWQKATVFQQAAFVLVEPPTAKDDFFSENVSLVTDTFSAPVTLEQYFQITESAIRQALKQVQIESSGDVEIAGLRAKWLRYTHVMKAGELTALQYYLVKGGKGYVLTYTAMAEAFPRYKTLFEENALTLQIK